MLKFNLIYGLEFGDWFWGLWFPPEPGLGQLRSKSGSAGACFPLQRFLAILQCPVEFHVVLKFEVNWICKLVRFRV